MVVITGVIGALDLATTRLYIGQIRQLVDENPATTSYMERATNAGRGPRHWVWMPVDSIPAIAKCAVVFAENRTFFKIGTLDWPSQRALFERLLHGDFSRGSSGIVQQLARNLYLGPQRTPRRKAREYLLAWQLSHTLTKERQLELYLNVVEWGQGVWGIGAASQHYFGRPPSKLTPTQAIILATLLPAPRRGLKYTTSESVARRMDLVNSMLTRALLLDDLTSSATTERLLRLRTRMRAGLSPAEAVASVDSIMGPEQLAVPLNGVARKPLAEACVYDRR